MEGGAREGSYLSLNCRWRLRLFQKIAELSVSQKKGGGGTAEKKKSKIAKEHLTWSGQQWQQKIAKAEYGVRSRASTGTATKPKAEPARSALALAVAAHVPDPPRMKQEVRAVTWGNQQQELSRGPAGAGSRCSPDSG